MLEKEDYEAIIIGGGPAGLTTGLYLARAGYKTMLLEQGLLGGQIYRAEKVENYPGFPNGVSGKDLIDSFARQSMNFGLEIQPGRVERLKADGEWKTVEASGFPFRARVVVLAVGLVQRLGIKGEMEFLGKGVSYCATCDGALYRGRPVAVIGSNDWAMEEAEFLTRFADRTTIVTAASSNKLTSEGARRVLDHPTVVLVDNASPLEILGDESGVQQLLANVKGETEPRSIETDAVFIFSGHLKPSTDFLRGVLPLDEKGYIVVGNDCETSVPGVFAIGDARRQKHHQVATAVGDGAIAGMEAIRFLKNTKN